jgi:hypothetical protein
MRLPHIDLKELEDLKKKNFEERLKFIDQYAEWVKKQQNKKWSAGQKEVIS